MKTARVKVNLGARSYEAVIGDGAVDLTARFLKKFKLKRAFIISDQHLVEHRKKLVEILKTSRWEVQEFPKAAGESIKEFEQILPVYGELLDAKANRDSVLFALGGGTIGDAAGFVAATYLRGIPWVGIPTTLLAQVDSSLGGKTGINHPQGKNLIGTFHQPSLVICDTQFLKTLSRREMISGISEMIKYGIVFDPKFFKEVSEFWPRALEHDSKTLTPLIQKSLQWKAKAVSRDEFDRKGVREALNFGHTLGHALEAATHYSYFQHGEAVLWGMRFATTLSMVKKKLPAKDGAKILSTLNAIPVPAIPPHLTLTELLPHLSKDKKIRNQKLYFVLLRKLGQAYSESEVGPDEVQAAFQKMKEGSK